jgi:hypothetical protein
MKNLTGLERTIRFQKAVRSADRAATPGEADAAMNAARRLMEAYQIDPVTLHVGSFYDRGSFATRLLSWSWDRTLRLWAQDGTRLDEGVMTRP